MIEDAHENVAHTVKGGDTGYGHQLRRDSALGWNFDINIIQEESVYAYGGGEEREKDHPLQQWLFKHAYTITSAQVTQT